MNAVRWLARAASEAPAKVAIAVGEAPWINYGKLAGRVASLAGAFRRRASLEPGDRVALVMKNSPRYLEALYAAWWAGLAAVPVNAKLHPREVRYILENSEARMVLVDADWSS